MTKRSVQAVRWTARVVAAGALVLALFAIPMRANAQAQTPVLQQALLTFEQNMRWEAVSPAWRGARGPWVQAVRSATTPQAVAAQVLMLESQMGWSAVREDHWRAVRPGWVASLRAASTDAEVARALIALEDATRWSAVNERAWRAARGGWVATLRAVAGQ